MSDENGVCRYCHCEQVTDDYSVCSDCNFEISREQMWQSVVGFSLEKWFLNLVDNIGMKSVD